MLFNAKPHQTNKTHELYLVSRRLDKLNFNTFFFFKTMGIRPWLISASQCFLKSNC